MDFAYDDRTQDLRERLSAFMDEQVYPAEPTFREQAEAAEAAGRPWERLPVTAELKAEARRRGLWNLFLTGKAAKAVSSLEQQERWLRPLLEGTIRSAFCMTEPAVASSDASNIATTISKTSDGYVINGRKWWSSGALSSDCKIFIVMGVTGEAADGQGHRRHSMILVPSDTPGV